MRSVQFDRRHPLVSEGLLHDPPSDAIPTPTPWTTSPSSVGGHSVPLDDADSLPSFPMPPRMAAEASAAARVFLGSAGPPSLSSRSNSVSRICLDCVLCVGIWRAIASPFASKLSSRAISAPCTPDSIRLFENSWKRLGSYQRLW